MTYFNATLRGRTGRAINVLGSKRSGITAVLTSPQGAASLRAYRFDDVDMIEVRIGDKTWHMPLIGGPRVQTQGETR